MKISRLLLPVFAAVHCPSLQTLLHGTSTSNDTTLGIEATIICHQGYHLNNRSSVDVTCGPNKTWSGINEDCLPIWCGPTPNITRGNKDREDGYYMDVVTYVCDEGFWYKKGQVVKEVTCRSDGTWDVPTDELLCSDVFCFSPQYSDCSSIHGDHKYKYFAREKVNMTCVEGMKLSNGDNYAISICDKSGEWNPQLPECVESRSSARATASKLSEPTESTTAQRVGLGVMIAMGVCLGIIIALDIPSFIEAFVFLKANIGSQISRTPPVSVITHTKLDKELSSFNKDGTIRPRNPVTPFAQHQGEHLSNVPNSAAFHSMQTPKPFSNRKPLNGRYQPPLTPIAEHI